MQVCIYACMLVNEIENFVIRYFNFKFDANLEMGRRSQINELLPTMVSTPRKSETINQCGPTKQRQVPKIRKPTPATERATDNDADR